MILSFQNRFEDPIVAGTKIHTFRLDPNNRWKVGMPIQFYVNARQKTMRKFRDDGDCTAIQRVQIVGIQAKEAFAVRVFHGSTFIEPTKIFARLDGFDSVEDFRQCLQQLHGYHAWKHSTYSIEGKVIHWTNFRY